MLHFLTFQVLFGFNLFPKEEEVIDNSYKITLQLLDDLLIGFYEAQFFKKHFLQNIILRHAIKGFRVSTGFGRMLGMQFGPSLCIVEFVSRSWINYRVFGLVSGIDYPMLCVCVKCEMRYFMNFRAHALGESGKNFPGFSCGNVFY